MKTVVLSDSDWDEIINALECVQSDRCGSEEERQQVQEVIDRVEQQTDERGVAMQKACELHQAYSIPQMHAIMRNVPTKQLSQRMGEMRQDMEMYGGCFKSQIIAGIGKQT